MSKLYAILIAGFGLSFATIDAAEIRFRETANVAGSVVTLGDVAEIRGGNTQETVSLASVSLFPTPVEGSNAYAEEILETLELRGVAVRDLIVTGSRVVAVRPVAGAKSIARPRASSAPSILPTSATVPTGGFAAYEAAVVERDARLANAPTSAAPRTVVRDEEPKPVVRRGEPVQATVVAGAVVVTTRGVAESDGALGQRVTIRSLDRKRTFDGVVVGPQSVRVGGER